jgi:hypothetical protein
MQLALPACGDFVAYSARLGLLLDFYAFVVFWF